MAGRGGLRALRERFGMHEWAPPTQTKLGYYRRGKRHCLRNMVHNLSSSRHPWEREIRSSSTRADEASTRRCEIKGRPWGMMRLAKFKCLSSDRSSRLRQQRLLTRVAATRIILSIFSLGSETWDFTESRLMPRNSMDVAGPRVFSCAMGITSSEHFFWTVRIWAAGMASGGEMIRKSSKRWMRWGMA